MEELSKKDILSLIGENLTTVRHQYYKGFDEGTDLEEMPIDPSHREWPKRGEAPDPDKPNKRTKQLKKWERLYALDDDDKVVEHVGWYGRNPETNESVPIIFTCEWDELTQKYPNLVPQLKEKFGNVNLVEKLCINDKPRGELDKLGIKPIPGSDEVVKVTQTQYRPGYDEETGDYKTRSSREKSNRTLNKIISDSLEKDDDFKNALKKYSLPQIIVTSGPDANKHRNRHSTNTNEEVLFQTHNINTHETQDSFFKFTTDNIKARNPEELQVKNDKSLRRLYNNQYRRWSKSRFTSTSGYGKTPILKLDSGDFPNDEKFEVMVSSDVKIRGIASAKNEEGAVTEWTWTATYLVEYAKKRPIDRIARKLVNDVEIDETVKVELSEPKIFDGKESEDTGDNHPMSDVNIVEGLKQLLSNFKEQIINPKQKAQSIRRAMASIADKEGALNESKKKKK